MNLYIAGYFVMALIFLFVIFIMGLKILDLNRLIKISEDNPKIAMETIKLFLEKNDIIGKVDSIVDSFINESANMYRVLSLTKNQNNYIKEHEISEMTNYIFLSVKKNMTTVILTLISLVHVIENDEELDKYLNIRIKLYMINFVTQYNQLQ